LHAVLFISSGALESLLDSDGREEAQELLREFPSLLAEAMAGLDTWKFIGAKAAFGSFGR